MNIYVAALMVGALVAAFLNYNCPRALLWIVVGAADFAFTYLYGLGALRSPDVGIYAWVPHPFLTGVTDGFVAILLATFGVTRWERIVRYVFVGSIAISAARLFGSIDRAWHAELLEGANWLALLVIGGAGILRLLDNVVVGEGARAGAGGPLHRARCFFDRKTQPESVFAQAIIWRR